MVKVLLVCTCVNFFEEFHLAVKSELTLLKLS